MEASFPGLKLLRSWSNKDRTGRRNISTSWWHVRTPNMKGKFWKFPGQKIEEGTMLGMNHWQLQEAENTHKKFKGTQKALASADASSGPCEWRGLRCRWDKSNHIPSFGEDRSHIIIILCAAWEGQLPQERNKLQKKWALSPYWS